MKIFPRYIAAHFWGPFLFGMAVFAILVFLADSFENLNTFIKSQAPTRIIIKYLVLRIPYWTMKIIPVATLLAVLFALGELINAGEWKAGLAGGYHPGQMVLPLILCSAAVAAGSFVLQESLVSSLQSKAMRIYRKDIRGDSDWKGLKAQDVTLSAGKDRFISARIFDAEKGTMQRVVLDIYQDRHLAFQIDALSARWDSPGKRWVFISGVERRFTSSRHAPRPQPAGAGAALSPISPWETGLEGRADTSLFMERNFKTWRSDIEISPRDLIIDAPETEDLTIRETLNRLRRLKKIGASTLKEQVAFQSKLAFPLSNIVMCLLGIPFALRLRMFNRMRCFGLSIGTAFLFWWVMSLGQTAGESGALAPAIAAWGPLVIFGIAGACGFKKAMR